MRELIKVQWNQTFKICGYFIRDMANDTRVFISEFERIAVPSDVMFPGNAKCYACNSDEYGPPPRKIREFFRNNKGANKSVVNGKLWEKSHEYYIAYSDLKEKILSQVEPYLKYLTGLIDTEVTRKQLFPREMIGCGKVLRTGECAYEIGDTDHQLILYSDGISLSGSSVAGLRIDGFDDNIRTCRAKVGNLTYRQLN